MLDLVGEWDGDEWAERGGGGDNSGPRAERLGEAAIDCGGGEPSGLAMDCAVVADVGDASGLIGSILARQRKGISSRHILCIVQWTSRRPPHHRMPGATAPRRRLAGYLHLMTWT